MISTAKSSSYFRQVKYRKIAIIYRKLYFKISLSLIIILLFKLEIKVYKTLQQTKKKFNLESQKFKSES